MPVQYCSRPGPCRPACPLQSRLGAELDAFLVYQIPVGSNYGAKRHHEIIFCCCFFLGGGVALRYGK